MANSNKNLQEAKIKQDDEFYTIYDDIAREVEHYAAAFYNKVVYCNCDNPLESNFAKYFINNFEKLKIKKLFVTCYNGIADAFQLSFFDEEKAKNNNANAYKFEKTPDGETLSLLHGNGNYKSRECLDILKQCDIVCTNPPFSLIRDFVRTIEKYGKEFLIVAPITAAAYKNILRLIQAGRCSVGYNSLKYFINMQGEKVCFGTIKWLTSLDVVREPLPLTEKYTPAKYKKYDNLDAVNVDRVCDIPADYSGLLGVPVSFLEKYCRDQFELLGIGRGTDGKELTLDGGDVVPFRRVIIKKI
ncbi:MAG: adenine-specific methyltransferase EcoRI family protein [Clostridia bacterium]|nr:adenine-specific methyltransferase EcoRI family protein [Clostridia bacterium]